MTETKTTGQSNGGQMRITDDEIRLIKATFKDNEPLLKLMRKMFLPELDPTAPLGQMLDLWMTVSIKDMSPEEAYVNLLARNTLISHLDQVLLQMSLISKMEEQSPAEVVAKLKANSTK
jgi:hypothetical protein